MIKNLLILSIFIAISCITLDECDDFESEKQRICSGLAPEKTGEYCSLINNECKSIERAATYSDCEEYSGNKKEECEAITASNSNFKCVLDGTCKKKLHECSDFKTSSSCEYHYNIVGDGKTKRCLFTNSKCEEHFDDCTKITDQTQCNSNILTDGKKKCVWKTTCVEEDKVCTDYKYGDSVYCWELKISGNDANKQCIYDQLNRQCIENYSTCSGRTQAECTSSILPWDETYHVVKYNYKCVWDTTCQENQKTCDEYKSEYSRISLDCNSDFIIKTGTDSRKSCVLINDACIEEYATCSDYSGDDINEATCTGIKLTSSTSEKYKCVYTDSPKQCTQELKTCKDFKLEALKNTCENIIPNFSKKCVYSNGNCAEQKKTCSELASSSSATQAICEAAATSDSSKKKCELKSDKSGCQEVDIPQENPSGSSSTDGNHSENIKSKMIFAVICLLLL